MTWVGFPGICRLSNGNLMCTYRQSNDHDVVTGTNHGVIYQETSTDNGATWGTKTTVVDDASEYDARDPSMLVTTSGTILVFHTIAQSAALSDYSAWVARSTDSGSSWTQIALTNNFTDYAVCCGIPVQLSNGDILVGLYGEDTGDTRQSARVVRSTDDGATWAHLADIGDGPTDGRDYQEPGLVVLGNGDVLCFLRTSGNNIFTSRSTDNGATWSAAGSIFAGTGRPAPLRTSGGDLLLYYRSATNVALGVVRQSPDDATSWSDIAVVATDGTLSTYGQLVQINSKAVGLIHSYEFNSATEGVVRFDILSVDNVDRL